MLFGGVGKVRLGGEGEHGGEGVGVEDVAPADTTWEEVSRGYLGG